MDWIKISKMFVRSYKYLKRSGVPNSFFYICVQEKEADGLLSATYFFISQICRRVDVDVEVRGTNHAPDSLNYDYFAKKKD